MSKSDEKFHLCSRRYSPHKQICKRHEILILGELIILGLKSGRSYRRWNFNFVITAAMVIVTRITLGMVVFSILSMVVMVRTEVTPSVTRAAVESEGIQNEIQDKMTIREHGA